MYTVATLTGALAVILVVTALITLVELLAGIVRLPRWSFHLRRTGSRDKR